LLQYYWIDTRQYNVITDPVYQDHQQCIKYLASQLIDTPDIL